MPVTRQLIINGEHVPAASGRVADDISPWSGETYAQVAAAGAEDVARAVDAAEAAFPQWAAMAPSDRAKIFSRAADLTEQRTPEAIELMAGEVGGVSSWAGFNAHLAAGMFRAAAAATTATQGQILATDMPGKLSFGVRRPYGVCAAISPWNAPLILGTRAVAIPLAVGNTVVLKPSEDAPIACGLFIADILMEAGLPAGVLNVVTNDRTDGPGVVEALISDERVHNVNFTGSTKVGRTIGTLAAQHLKPAVLELGGKNSLVVLEDADLEYAVNAATFGAFMNAGQICMSVDRVVVDRRIADEFSQAFAKKVADLPAGDPAKPETVIGPQVNQAAADRQWSQIQDAIEKGARVLAGGGKPDGRVVPATVLADITPDMRIHAEEIFGAATTIYTAADADDAVTIANDTQYGLTAGVITENLREGLQVAQRLRTGIVHVNDQPVNDEPMAPFGGIQNSGYGKFGGEAGIHSFTEIRWVTVQQEGHAPYPF
ncbi:MAG: aldehyde dehydrogenase family protein [Intrasporangium sp.]|uniref:aldehyde dehydrogenase family protein n=1 Tax=Intrasporangium sp. TaxID=1925024 RepID=UPI003F802076